MIKLFSLFVKVETEDEGVVEGRRGLVEPLGPVNILINLLSKVITEDEDVVEGRRGLVEPLGPVNILTTCYQTSKL